VHPPIPMPVFLAGEYAGIDQKLAAGVMIDLLKL
jgi:hypothetical protein